MGVSLGVGPGADRLPGEMKCDAFKGRFGADFSGRLAAGV